MTVNEFVSLWNGLDVSFPNCENNQCMTLVHRYVSEVLKIEDISVLARPIAAQVWTNFGWGQYFTQTTNTPDNVPSPGDIVIWGANPTVGIPDGHIAIFLSGDVNTFTSFDANFPTGSKPHRQTHSYTDVLGWLTPNGNLVTQDAVPIADTQQIQTLTDSVNSCQSQLKESTAQAASLQNQLTQATERVQSKQEELNEANTKITSLQTKLGDEQKEIINLNTRIEQQASSDKDYALEIYTLTHDNQAITSSFNSVVDGLGISRTSKTLDQITKDALSKEDDIDTLLKAAGIASGILHNVAKELGFDDPNATPQQIGDRIIQYAKSLGGKLQNLSIPKPQIAKSTNGYNLFKWLGLWQ